VNEVYDDGEHIFQTRCPVHEDETPETLALKIHALEHAHFPEVVEKWLNKYELRGTKYELKE
jgi:phosphoribosylglycinamide formyltransferase-1